MAHPTRAEIFALPAFSPIRLFAISLRYPYRRRFFSASAETFGVLNP
jgi:hypothetical protein